MIDSKDIERTAAADLTDVLKKNSGVDVIQYPGVLSGVGIRGFRPEFSGINKRSLLLINGRPAGSTNLGTILLGNIDRVEVLKGPASSVYGASAMGGVVNIITRQSRGPIAARVTGSLGSFSTSDFTVSAGGSLSKRVDFDATANAFNQRDDFRLGDGIVRPATSYRTYDGSARLGTDLGGAWRLDGRLNLYRGRDILTPGDVFDGVNNQGKKNLERSTGDVGLSGQVGRHLLSTTVFASNERSHTSRITSTNALDRPYLPFLSSESDIAWLGAQARDSWGWSKGNNLVYGLDYETIESVSRFYERTGARKAPFSADNRKTTYGVVRREHAEAEGWRHGRVDGRPRGRDHDGRARHTIQDGLQDVEHDDHHLQSERRREAGPGSEPARARDCWTSVRPRRRGGAHWLHGDDRRRPTADHTRQPRSQAGAKRQLRRGAGVVGALDLPRCDVFPDEGHRPRPRERGHQQSTPPDPVLVSYVNALGARIKGMDVDFNQRLSTHLSAFSNITHYFARREELPTTGERNILNVATNTNTVRAGFDLDIARFSGRIAARYVQSRQDNDFNVAGTPVIDYPDFVVAQLNLRYAVHDQHAVSLVVNNLFDELYFEKKGFPLAGRAIAFKYQFDIRRNSRRP